MPLILIASAIVGCRSATPAAVAPSIEAWSTLGLSCGEPRADNVPSGLFQWTCRSDHRGIPLTLLVDGDDHGVFMMTAQVPGGTDPRARRRGVRRSRRGKLAPDDGPGGGWSLAPCVGWRPIDDQPRGREPEPGARHVMGHVGGVSWPSSLRQRSGSRPVTAVYRFVY